MYETYEQCKAALFAEIDEKYDNFNNPIVNCEGYPTRGVRTPVIKKLAKSVPLSARDEVLNGFFADTELTYETVLFTGVLAARKGEYYSQTREYISRLVPLFRSWAHVDCVTPCLRWADKDALWHDFRYLLDCEGQYEKRFYIMIMFSCCLNDEYVDKILETLRYNVTYGQYYVDMAAAWLLAECLVKYYDKALPLFATQVFPKFVHNKAIQKARESFRISPDIKAYLNTLKVK
ncbi:MAG: DNA alkylation repair protein [Clostridiales bacterium]|nr:DNA alkylation repair protein [Clostridiales bacterium]